MIDTDHSVQHNTLLRTRGWNQQFREGWFDVQYPGVWRWLLSNQGSLLKVVLDDYLRLKKLFAARMVTVSTSQGDRSSVTEVCSVCPCCRALPVSRYWRRFSHSFAFPVWRSVCCSDVCSLHCFLSPAQTLLTLRFPKQKLKVQFPCQKWTVVLNCADLETPTFYNQLACAMM